jgi:hypothetical protein
MTDESMTRNQDQLAADETGQLISSEKVSGTSVYNRSGDSLGTIDHVMIDKLSGNVTYVVMSSGGFLGIGENYNPVPWGSLAYDVNLGGYVLDADRSRLERAPRFSSSNQGNWSDPGYAHSVNQYWE